MFYKNVILCHSFVPKALLKIYHSHLRISITLSILGTTSKSHCFMGNIPNFWVWKDLNVQETVSNILIKNILPVQSVPEASAKSDRSENRLLDKSLQGGTVQ